MKIQKMIMIGFILLLSVGFLSCDKKDTAADYSQASNWLSLPAAVDKEADVFYLYPTSWQKTGESDADVCEIDNPMMIKYSQYAFERQATAFETVGNIYAPYYRQEDAATALSMSVEDSQKLIGGIPATDALAAFDYYIKNYNHGRPFILAGHSQGSNVLTFLLSEYMKENPEVYDRMIAAYVIGYSITDEYLAENPHLRFAEGPDDTGVIISYNTQAPVIEGSNPVVLPGALVINPITWTRDETLAAAGQNLGSIALNPDGTVVCNADGTFKEIKNHADAQVNLKKGVLICSTADVDTLAPGNAVFGRGVFHSFDYAFYYYNLRQNAENRTAVFFSKS